jgi:hypothetical protein
MSGLVGRVDPGLLERFRRAATEIQWREAPGSVRKTRSKTRVRIAHLNDEEARVEVRSPDDWVVDSGPVGALVLLSETDRRGVVPVLASRNAGELPGFGQGALEANWSAPERTTPGSVRVADLVALARYALA